MEDVKRSLVRKLAEVMAAVDRIPKSGHNNFHNYDYAMEADITSAVRGELAKRQVMMIPSVTKTEFIEGKNAKGNVERIYTVTATFTFHDGESGETLPFVMVGQGSDPSDKGLFKSLTGLVKYAIMKSFLIPTGDDPEREEAAPLAKSSPAKPKEPAKPAEPPKPTAADVAVLVDSFAALGVTVSELEKRLGWPLATMSAADMAGLRKFYAEKRAAAKNPDLAAQNAVKAQAEAAMAAFAKFIERIKAAPTEKDVTLIQAEAAALKWTKGDLAAMARAASDRMFLLKEAAKKPEQTSGDVPF